MPEQWLVHTLVFDLDDTLFMERDYVFSGFAAAGRWLDTHHAVTDSAAVFRQLFSAGQRERIFDTALALLRVDAGPAAVSQLLAIYRQHEPKLQLLEDAVEFLDWASTRFHLALITDGYALVQTRKIRALGLEARIACRILTDELGREFWKPSLEPYRRIMACYPGPADGYVYIADNPHKDFQGARQLGWRTVRVRRAGGQHAKYEPATGEAAEVEFDSLIDLRGILQRRAIQ